MSAEDDAKRAIWEWIERNYPQQGKPGVGRFTLGADVDWTEIDGERI